MVVPKESFGVGGRRRRRGRVGGAHKDKDFEAEKHREKGEARLEVTADKRTVRFGVEYKETTIGDSGKAGVVLVEGELMDE